MIADNIIDALVYQRRVLRRLCLLANWVGEGSYTVLKEGHDEHLPGYTAILEAHGNSLIQVQADREAAEDLAALLNLACSIGWCGYAEAEEPFTEEQRRPKPLRDKPSA